jgi:hypothetical protein
MLRSGILNPLAIRAFGGRSFSSNQEAQSTRKRDSTLGRSRRERESSWIAIHPKLIAIDRLDILTMNVPDSPCPALPASILTTKFRRTTMHARLMQAKAKPGQVKEFVKALVERGLPILKQQPGFIDALALTCRWRITEITQLSGFGISLDNASAVDNN